MVNATNQTCSKCGYHNISGPHYDKMRDMLQYRCKRCGYDWHGSTYERHKAAIVVDASFKKLMGDIDDDESGSSGV